MKSILFCCGLTASVISAAAQDSAQVQPPLAISGYIEVYYTYDFGLPASHNRPVFLYSHNRHNEAAINLAMIKAAYRKDRVRANIAFMAGTYANANLSAEPGVLKNLYEANAGIRLSAKHDLWIDAGVFSSHIGFESAVGKDNWTLTRSMAAENSPYYETGARIVYTSASGKWQLSGLVLNGWQRMQRIDGNNTPAFGHQVTWKPGARITVNSSSFIGSDRPDSLRQMRYFHDLYAIIDLNHTLSLTAGFDIGFEQTAKKSKTFNSWYAPVLLLRCGASEKSTLTARIEYYCDRHGIIVDAAAPDGFRTWGYSMNYDLRINDNLLWRTEAREFAGSDGTFLKNGQPASNNFALTTAIAISF